ncbi:sulfotransferase family protein [Leisingera sp. ANG-S5]|uniref:sulfotransferase family protein n=1 Tax=Leisingera sp. ANG-S5 TaxID=1577901 RepID=UPI00068D6D03|nr:sulfotransferase family protein [Leisingera sp. ANG-S5]
MKQFILGIGGQKCGTTWLYDYIIADSRFKRGAIKPKELHVWDHKEIPEFFPRRRRLSQVLNLSRYHLWRMERSDEYYFDYFARLLETGGTAVDITPSYSGLSQSTLEKIQEGFARRGVPVKCVFLMRDPVARCVSAFGHNKVRARPGEVRMGVDEAKETGAAFRAFFTSESCRYRTQYEVTIERAQAAFGAEDFASFLYEEIFSGGALEPLSAFLGLPCQAERLGKKSNVARKSYDMDADALRDCARFYEGTYRSIAALQPAVLQLWPGMRSLDF